MEMGRSKKTWLKAVAEQSRMVWTKKNVANKRSTRRAGANTSSGRMS